jgi:hypothetical protein
MPYCGANCESSAKSSCGPASSQPKQIKGKSACSDGSCGPKKKCGSEGSGEGPDLTSKFLAKNQTIGIDLKNAKGITYIGPDGKVTPLTREQYEHMDLFTPSQNSKSCDPDGKNCKPCDQKKEEKQTSNGPDPKISTKLLPGYAAPDAKPKNAKPVSTVDDVMIDGPYKYGHQIKKPEVNKNMFEGWMDFLKKMLGQD